MALSKHEENAQCGLVGNFFELIECRFTVDEPREYTVDCIALAHEDNSPYSNLIRLCLVWMGHSQD